MYSQISHARSDKSILSAKSYDTVGDGGVN